MLERWHASTRTARSPASWRATAQPHRRLADQIRLATMLPPVALGRAQPRSIGLRRAVLKLEGKIDEPRPTPEHDAEVAIRPDQPYFIPDTLGDKRSLRVVQHDALLA